jgi:hypothetical protein
MDDTNKWLIEWQDLTRTRIIGEGAFGKVGPHLCCTVMPASLGIGGPADSMLCMLLWCSTSCASTRSGDGSHMLFTAWGCSGSRLRTMPARWHPFTGAQVWLGRWQETDVAIKLLGSLSALGVETGSLQHDSSGGEPEPCLSFEDSKDSF